MASDAYFMSENNINVDISTDVVLLALAEILHERIKEGLNGTVSVKRVSEIIDEELASGSEFS